MKIKAFSKLILLTIFFSLSYCVSKTTGKVQELDLGEEPIALKETRKNQPQEKNVNIKDKSKNVDFYVINMQEVGLNSNKLAERQADKQNEYQAKNAAFQEEGKEFERLVQAFQKDMQSGLKSKDALKAQEQVLMEKQQALMIKQQQIQTSLQQDMMQLMQEIKDDVNDYIKDVTSKNPSVVVLQSELYINPEFDYTQEAIKFINKKFSDSKKIANKKNNTSKNNKDNN